MIDTGAEKTAIDNRLLRDLAIPPIRFDQVVGVSQREEEFPVYLIELRIDVIDGSKSHEYFFPTEAIGVPSPMDGRPYNGFIGRDFLAHWHLSYDGPSGVVLIQIQP